MKNAVRLRRQRICSRFCISSHPRRDGVITISQVVEPKGELVLAKGRSSETVSVQKKDANVGLPGARPEDIY